MSGETTQSENPKPVSPRTAWGQAGNAADTSVQLPTDRRNHIVPLGFLVNSDCENKTPSEDVMTSATSKSENDVNMRVYSADEQIIGLSMGPHQNITEMNACDSDEVRLRTICGCGSLSERPEYAQHKYAEASPTVSSSTPAVEADNSEMMTSPDQFHSVSSHLETHQCTKNQVLKGSVAPRFHGIRNKIRDFD